ncbi:DNA-3-methyladenine glycosylase family protein [Pseudomonas sp. NPDC089534]|uniref:DNA-3-methyladenine glycosylase family protein n=1 Tax=Pseudomonas sp. NPDC089534 TaxID=3364468 RepID=UPI003830D020
MRLRLDFKASYDWPAMLGFLGARAVAGMETVDAGVYSRIIGLNGVRGTVSVRPGDGEGLDVALDFPEPAAVPEIVARLRRLFGLDAEVAPMQRHLVADPLLARLIAERPGLRVPGAWDGLELAFRAVLGQQITVTAAIRLAGKLVTRYGVPVRSPVPGLTHAFPEASVLAVADLAALGMPKSRGRTLSGVAQALLEDPSLFESGVPRLLALHGIGDWTAQYIALRQLRDMDGFPTGDVGLLRALEVLEGRRPTARELTARAEGWRPYRGYAAQVLWTSLGRGD